MPEVKTNTAMSVHDLMKPRYKVIADYPKAGFGIGHIYEKDNSDIGFSNEDWCLWYDKYPALFKKLEWWEKREVSQMPEYLKLATSRPVSFEAVKNWTLDDEGNWWVSFRGHSHCLNMWAVEPATLEDYQTSNK